MNNTLWCALFGPTPVARYQNACPTTRDPYPLKCNLPVKASFPPRRTPHAIPSPKPVPQAAVRHDPAMPCPHARDSRCLL